MGPVGQPLLGFDLAQPFVEDSEPGLGLGLAPLELLPFLVEEGHLRLEGPDPLGESGRLLLDLVEPGGPVDVGRLRVVFDRPRLLVQALELGLGRVDLPGRPADGVQDLRFPGSQGPSLLLEGFLRLLLFPDEGPEPGGGGLVLPPQGLDPRVDLVPCHLVGVHLFFEGGELLAFLGDAVRRDVFAPGLLSELLPERRLLLLFPPELGLEPEPDHAAPGPRQEGAQPPPQALVAQEDDEEEEEDDAEEEPEGPEGEALAGLGLGLEPRHSGRESAESGSDAHYHPYLCHSTPVVNGFLRTGRSMGS